MKMEMPLSQIKTIGDFRRFVLLLADGIALTTTKSLEEYLRALGWLKLVCLRTNGANMELVPQLVIDGSTLIPLLT
jgi:hypothetical protein